MIDLDGFEAIAADMAGRTVTLSGETCALLFTALDAVADINQWFTASGLTAADIDRIDELVSNAISQVIG